MPAPSGHTSLCSFSSIPAHLADSVFFQICCKVFYRALHFTEASRLSFPKIIACLVPERKIHGCQVWVVCWPGMLQVTRQDAASKFRFEEVQARRKDMTWGTILYVPILLLCSQYSNRWPHGILKQVQIHFTINTSLEPNHRKASSIDDSRPGHAFLSASPLALCHFLR